jgi:hypothetical protein
MLHDLFEYLFEYSGERTERHRRCQAHNDRIKQENEEYYASQRLTKEEETQIPALAYKMYKYDEGMRTSQDYWLAAERCLHEGHPEIWAEYISGRHGFYPSSSNNYGCRGGRDPAWDDDIYPGF